MNQIKVALRSAWRNFKKNVGYGSLNIIGLSFAFACVILLGSYVHQERNFDAFHENADRIYRPTHQIKGENDFELHFARVPVNFINELPYEMPEIEALVRFQNKEQKYIRIGEKRFKPHHAYVTDAEVFEVFTYPLLSGSSSTALQNPYSVVLTEKTAMQYFGRTDVVGEEIAVVGDWSPDEQVYQITGVMENVPSASHLPVEMFFSFANEEERTGWAYIYTLLKEGASIEQVRAKTPAFIDHYTESQGDNTIHFHFQALRDIHLTSDLAREIQPNGKAYYVNLVFAVALLVWLIALVNFANLSAALAMRRTKEVGVRRILGAAKNQMSSFALIESCFFSFAALLLGAMMAYGLFPFCAKLLGVAAPMPPEILLPVMLGLGLATGLIAGLVPARYLHKLEAIQLFRKGEAKDSTAISRKFTLKRILVAGQFAMTILLLSCAFIAQKQFNFLQHKNLGIETEQIVSLSQVPSLVTEKYGLLKERLLTTPGVKSVSACMQVPSSEIRDMGPVRVFGRDEELQHPPMMDMQIIDPDFLEMMNLELVAGSDYTKQAEMGPVPEFDDDYTTATYLGESSRQYFINETAMRQLGFASADESIGRQVNWSIGPYTLAYGPIAGVIKDYHQESLRNKVDPMIMTMDPIWLQSVLVKVDVAQLSSTLPAIQGVWQDLFPFAFEYSFLDELFAKLYTQDRVQLQLLRTLTFLAIFISILGLIGLVAFTLQTRAKELAIRRVIGANLASLGKLMSKEYLWVLVVAGIVAIPVSFYLVRLWLESFAYRITVSATDFLWAFVPILLLVIGIIFLQTWRATLVNPVRVLRDD